MREIVSPLDGIRSPFGSAVSPLAIYAVLGIRPELVLDFDDEKYFANSTRSTFSDAITHSATTNATMVDSDGLLKWRPHNLLTYSEQFDNAAWGKANVTVTANTAVAPDGSMTADLLKQSVVSSTTVQIFEAQTISAGVAYTYSVFIKQNDCEDFIKILLGSGNQGSGFGVSIDPSDMSVQYATAGGTGYVYLSHNVISVGNGWHRVSITGSSSTTTSVAAYIGFNDAATGNLTTDRITNGGTGSIYIWGAHLYRSDLGGMVNNPDRGDSYVPTTSSAMYLPRRGHHVYNGSAWVNEGLLHESEARTNLIAGSNDFLPANNYWQEYIASNRVSVTAAQAIGPDGETSMALLTDGLIAAAPHGITTAYDQAGITIPNNTPFTVSCHFKNLDRRYVTLAGSGVTSSNWFAATIDLLDGSVTQTGAGATATYLNSNVEDLSGGIYRLSITGQAADSATNASIWVFLSDTASPTYGGYGQSSHDGADLGVYIYGAQLEAGSTPSSYIPTSGSTVTRAAETLTVPSAKLPWPAPNVIGPELVTNGTFDTDLTGWFGYNDTPVWDASGRMLISAPSEFDGAKTGNGAVTGFTVGKVYLLSCDIELGTAASAKVEIYAGAGPTRLAIIEKSASGSYQAAFTATATTATIYAVSGTGAVGTAYFDNISVREIDPLAVSIQMQGRATGDTCTTTRWYLDANNYITQEIGASDFTFEQAASGTVDAVTGGSFASGVNTAFNFASTHASTLVAAAVGGTALTDNTTPVALADLSSTDLQLGHSFMGTLKLVRVWPENITEAGREEASA